MKKTVMTIALSSALIAGAGIGATSMFQTDEAAAAVKTAGDAISQYPEINKIESIIDTNGLTPEIVVDNYGKRILLFMDTSGQPIYKTIFIKRTNMLKVIDLDGGQLYHGSIR
ncbi:hypothetical protein AV656_13285 [Bhargavaea cecembensis]|uniref:PepSY domain-containing protein n=1 Tax=Bhargavaea cecembensis TaxID=394098 RepID=A0A163EYP7_9BACL|nr:hypothetical protein [Bhargavaea cecembensis]KZE37526.1 hypothetical protein AV656_13285 [Bhargavaea cecembensis]